MTSELVPLVHPIDFLPELLATCPELDGDWVEPQGLHPSSSTYGVMLGFTHAILPTLNWLLDPDGRSFTAPQGVKTADPLSLIARMYSLIERAALSAYPGLAEYVADELLHGYGSLSQDDLIRHARPATRSWVATLTRTQQD